MGLRRIGDLRAGMSRLRTSVQLRLPNDDDDVPDAAIILITAAPSSSGFKCRAGREVGQPECCRWFEVMDDLQDNLFHRSCGAEVRQSLRLQWHDAISYSLSQGPKSGGGADGSIIAFPEELTYHENIGLADIAARQRTFALEHNITFGDLVHFAGVVGLSNCAGAPNLRFLAGRANATQPAADGLVPAPFHSADTMLARMTDAGFSPAELVALLAGHSVATQHTIDPDVDGAPLDSTPHSFDHRFFAETVIKGTVCPGAALHKGEVLSSSRHQFRLQSDYALAHDPRTAPTWKAFAEDPEEMKKRFADAMEKLSVVGQEGAALVDCSDVISG
ncbi:fungal class II heme-containing peroxidase [Phanerochaete sordida]|uniref:Peroxidase n=1 Tax=Phanerochaete sordida TaxID=48140 RepID=A0A9P3G584_9APHY|nr:fungal class II heme-containing peroxidase [Phanerochaete sordida]